MLFVNASLDLMKMVIAAFRIFLLKSLNKTKVSNLMLGNFFTIAFFFNLFFFNVYHFTDINECKGFVLVTSDILEMEATAQVLNAFLLKPFPSERKPLSYLRDSFYQHTLY